MCAFFPSSWSSKGSELQKKCMCFFTNITIDSDTNTQAYILISIIISWDWRVVWKLCPRAWFTKADFFPISIPCVRPASGYSPWLVGARQHESHGATEIRREASVEGNSDMHFGYMPFVGHQGNRGLSSSWMTKIFDLWLVILGEIGFINHFDLEHLPPLKFHTVVGPQDFCRRVSTDSARKAKDWFFQNRFGKKPWSHVVFSKKKTIWIWLILYCIISNDLVLGAGIRPAQWRTVANALWCVLRVDLLGAEAWEHFQRNSCVQMSGNVWKREAR